MLRLSPKTHAVWLLGVTQVIGYGTLYYSFAILAGDVSRDFGISNSRYFGIFSIALVAGGLIMPFAGRAFDRRGAANLMVWGSLISGLSLLAVALSPDPATFLFAMVVVQIASGLVLYDAAFTALVQAFRSEGGRCIMHLTLIAGFASSIFWPLTQILTDSFGWRWTLLVFAGLNLLVCCPLHQWLRSHIRRNDDAMSSSKQEPPSHAGFVPLPLRWQRQVFVFVTAGFALSSITLAAVISQMVPLLQALGFGAAALVVSTLFGPSQVVVRFTNLLFGGRTHPLWITVFAMALLPLAFVVVGLTAPLLAGGIIFAVLIGMASGLKSIVQGTLPLALFGSHGYGARQGLMSAFRYVLAALSPFAFAWSSEMTDARTSSFIFAGIGGLGVLCFIAVVLLRKRALLV